MNRKKKAAGCSPEHLPYEMDTSNSDQESHLSFPDVISNEKMNSTGSKIILKQAFTKRKHRPYISRLLFYTILKSVQSFCFGFHFIINLKKCKKVQINWEFNSNCKLLQCSYKHVCSFTWSQYNMKKWLATLIGFLLIFYTACQITLPYCFPVSSP